ncbi:UNVERIFIED_CONTAM: hypothetical protein Scaly_1966500 [Sesamum calycinum]|uniref:Uncharacterized protein n=1 Tax=Sesamum calycinum TaxID=2727403 RepID=A0AAW2MZJ5_9LAMI
MTFLNSVKSISPSKHLTQHEPQLNSFQESKKHLDRPGCSQPTASVTTFLRARNTGNTGNDLFAASMVSRSIPEQITSFVVVKCRYFASVAVRDEHFKTKRHRKRLKQMMGPAPHTQLDAELAAGMGMPDNGPKLMST